MLNPNAKGAADPRAQSFLHLINHVLPELATERAHPRYMLIENVTGFQVRLFITNRLLKSHGDLALGNKTTPPINT